MIEDEQQLVALMRLMRDVSAAATTEERCLRWLTGLCDLTQSSAAILVTARAPRGKPPSQFSDIHCTQQTNGHHRRRLLDVVQRAWHHDDAMLHEGDAAVASVCAGVQMSLREGLGLLRDRPFDRGEARYIRHVHLETSWVRQRTTRISDSVLTPRQQEVVERLLAGDSESSIALSLGLSAHTVRDHVKAIYQTLGVHSRIALAGWMNGSGTGKRSKWEADYS